MNIFTRNNYIDSSSPFALSKFSSLVFNYLSSNSIENKDIILFCIGTDRSTGDSLGPLVGHKLEPIIKNYRNVYLMGTLENPIHAKNLEENLDKIKNDYNNPFIIAIDSSLGRLERVGHLSIKNSPLRPGAGVNKSLPPVGDISITGIVNIGGMMEAMVLQNTRLSLVMNMADIISKSIYLSLYRLSREEKKQYILEK
ncbi:spore protease YyaC [Tissierella pigra]|uniref:Spore protease YyaC n=1 Tax=Tissierella pigra TaxID=2607614 RepID=A0A6N7XL43_9FIRM|nr:spore protease YyaC [Tissierella pigra]MBU5424779.1 spore protease YyaC [Tissierella pigra]MSU02801.1 spore protease YyaC [Tissierella pigra]